VVGVPLAHLSTLRSSAKVPLQDLLVSANVPTGLDCVGLCWTGPLALMGIMCSGLRVEATPLTVPKRLHSLHLHIAPQPMLVSRWQMREGAVAASGGRLFIRPGCLRSLQALSQDVPEHERCEDD